MNAEIYFPRNGKAFGQTSENSFETTIKKLGGINVNIIYKTEINLTEESINEALKVSASGEEKIGLIFIADALSKDSTKEAEEFFESIGIIGKVKRIEAPWRDPLNEDSDTGSSGPAKQGKKKKKKKKTETGSEDLIDISAGNVVVEQKSFYAYSAEYNNKLIVLLPKHEDMQTSFSSVIYTAACKIVAPKKKHSFWKKFIPCKGDKAFDVIRKVILLIAIATFIVSSYMLINILIVEPAVNDHTTSSIRELLVSTPEGESSETKKNPDGSDGVLSDFSKLLEANPDTVGWITVPNTVIDYVVVQAPEDAEKLSKGEDPKYLYRDFYGNSSKYGTVFLDYRSSLDSKNMILHGHHMQDGRMFANITNFGDLETYKKSAVFTFNTLYEKSKWKIISVFKTNTLSWQGPVFNYLRGSFSSPYDFLNFVYELRVRSMIDCPVDVNENDTIVTLSTCTYDFDDFRFVVVARKVRDGESATVDVSKAKVAANPLYPDICYDYWGGTKPVVTSFQDAFNKGEIKWYDGTTEWSAQDDEDLAKQLVEGKVRAETQLRESYPKEKYEKEQQKEIDSIIRKYMESINEASDAAQVNSLFLQAKAELDQVKTKQEVSKAAEESRKASEEAEKQASEDAEKQASEEALNEAREEAVREIRQSVEGNEYGIAQYNQVQQLLDDYTDRITNASSVAAVDKLKEDAIRALGKIKTVEESSEESSRTSQQSSRPQESSDNDEAKRFAEYKKNSVSMISNYLDQSEYSDESQSIIRNIISVYTGKINDADSYSEVDEYISTAKNLLDSVEDEQSSDDQSSEPISEPSPVISEPSPEPSPDISEESPEPSPDISDESPEPSPDISEESPEPPPENSWEMSSEETSVE